MMMLDVTRLDDRVAKLATHFQQAEKDISDIQTSTRKITSRSQKITQIEVAEEKAVSLVSDAIDPKPDLLG